MIVNESIDWSRGEINISPENIQVKYIFSSDTATADDIKSDTTIFHVFPPSQYLWIPDVIIHDLVMFSKPEILNEVAALEIFHNQMVYYKIRSASTPSKFPCLQSKIITSNCDTLKL